MDFEGDDFLDFRVALYCFIADFFNGGFYMELVDMNKDFVLDRRKRIEISWLLIFIVMLNLVGVGVLMFFVSLLIGGMVR